MIKRNVETPSDLAYLRADLLRPVLFGVMAAVYIWYVIVFQPVNRLGSEVWGLVLLAAGLGIALATRNWSVSLSGAALIAGIVSANLYTIWQVDIAATPYLLAIAVSLTGLLFGLRTVVGVAVLCSSAVLGIGVVRWEHSIFSAELLSPLLVIGLVGILSSLMVRKSANSNISGC